MSLLWKPLRRSVVTPDGKVDVERPPDIQIVREASDVLAAPSLFSHSFNSEFRLPDNSFLNLAVFNSSAGVTLLGNVIIRRPDGSIYTGEFNFTPSSSAELDTKTISLGPGYLLSFHIYVSAGSPRRGQCFVKASLGLSPSPNPLLYAMFFSDYITVESSLSFPGGRCISSIDGKGYVRVVTGTDPSAGSEVSDTVPVNRLWKLLTTKITFVTDATVISRTVTLRLTNGGNVLYAGWANQSQVATETRNYTWGAGVGNIIASINTYAQGMLPVGVLLPAGFNIVTATQNIQAGDNFGTPFYLVEEFIQV